MNLEVVKSYCLERISDKYPFISSAILKKGVEEEDRGASRRPSSSDEVILSISDSNLHDV